VARISGDVQSKRAAASTSWTRRFAKRPADVAIVFSPSASRVIAVTRIARRRAAPQGVESRSARHASVIAVAPKGASIIAIISARTGRA
jgi:hypothetical protein